MIDGVLKEKYDEENARRQINKKTRQSQEQKATFWVLTYCSMQSEDERWRGVREWTLVGSWPDDGVSCESWQMRTTDGSLAWLTKELILLVDWERDVLSIYLSVVKEQMKNKRGNLYKEWWMFCLFANLFDFRYRFGRTNRVGSRVGWDTQFMKKHGDKRIKTERKLAWWNWTFRLVPHTESSPNRFWSQQFITHPLTAQPNTSASWRKNALGKKVFEEDCLQQRDWCNARSMHGRCTHHSPLDIKQSDLMPL